MDRRYFLSMCIPGHAGDFRCVAFEGAEGLSILFAYRLKVFVRDEADWRGLLGRSVALTVCPASAEAGQFFHGEIVRIEALEAIDSGWQAYYFHVAPSVTRLTRTPMCQVFQSKSVVEIVSGLLQTYQITDVVFQLRGAYSKDALRVQYDETVWHFIERLCTEVGIYYYFNHDHETQCHRLVFVDALEACPMSTQLAVDDIFEWSAVRRRIPSCVRVQSVDYPDQLHAFEASARTGAPGDSVMWCDVAVETAEAAQSVAQHAAEALAVLSSYYEGKSASLFFSAGVRFIFQDVGYYLHSVCYSAKDFSNVPFAQSCEVSQTFQCQFKAVPTSQPFRAPILPRPVRISGMQRAVVTGPPGQTVYTNAHGCVKVYFDWDPRNIQDEQSFIWVPVNQQWVGKQHGQFFLPPVGTQVQVIFLEGWPTRPVVLAMAHEGASQADFELPSEKNCVGFRSVAQAWTVDPRGDYPKTWFKTTGDFERTVMGLDCLRVGEASVDVTQGDFLSRVKDAFILNAKRRIVLQSGKSRITLSPEKINIDGARVDLNPASVLRAHVQQQVESITSGDVSRSVSPSQQAGMWQCLPIAPRWLLTTPYGDGSHPAAIFRLPAALREKVYAALIAAHSPMMQAIQPGRDPMAVQRVGLAAENNLPPLDLMHWQQLLKTQAPDVWAAVTSALSSVHACDVSLEPGYLYVFTRVQGTSTYHLFAEYVHVGAGTFAQICLGDYAGQNIRKASDRISPCVAAPYQNDRGDLMETVIGFSDVPLSWPRLHAMGGLSETDPRFALAKQHCLAAQAFLQLQGYAPVVGLVEKRFGSPLDLSPWVTDQLCTRYPSLRDVPMCYLAVRDDITPPTFFSNQSQRVFQQGELVRRAEDACPLILLADPVGMIARINSDLDYFWMRLNRLVQALSDNQTPSYVGDAHQVQKNYFQSAVLAQQLFFNTVLDGVAKKSFYMTDDETPFYTTTVGAYAGLIEAQENIDTAKLHWALRKKDRALLRALMHHGQTVVNAILMQANQSSAVDVIECIKDGFANTPAMGYARLLGLVSLSCQDPRQCDHALDFDPRFVNTLKEEDLPVSFSSSAVPLPARQRLVRTRFERTPGAHWKIVEVLDHALENSIASRQIEKIVDEPPPGFAFFRAMHRPDHPLYSVLFPVRLARDAPEDEAYLKGDGSFWPKGFGQTWRQKPLRHVARAFQFSNVAASYFDHVITAQLALASLDWERDTINHATQVRRVYLSMLAHGDPAFENETLIVQTDQHTEKEYRLLSAVLKPSKKRPKPGKAAYATVGEDGKLHFYRSADVAEQVIAKRAARYNKSIETRLGLLDMTYVKSDFKPDRFLATAKTAVHAIYTLYALFDFYQKTQAVFTYPGQWEVWVKWLIDCYETVEMVKDYYQRFSHRIEDSLVELAEVSKQTGKTVWEYLGYTAVGMNLALNLYGAYRVWARGDRRGFVSNLLQMSGSAGSLAQKLWARFQAMRTAQGHAGLSSARGASSELPSSAVRSGLVSEVGGAEVGAMAEEITLYSAETLASVLPGAKVLYMVLFFSGLIVGLDKDDRFDRWAKASPFARRPAPKDSYRDHDAGVLLTQLVDLMFTFSITPLQISGQPHVGALFLSLPWVGQSVQITLASRWQLTCVASCVVGMQRVDLPAQAGAGTQLPVVPLYLWPEGRHIGAVQRIVLPSTRTLNYLETQVQAQLAEQAGAGEYFLSRRLLTFQARAKLLSGSLQMPLAVRGHVAFDQDPSYVHFSKRLQELPASHSGEIK